MSGANNVRAGGAYVEIGGDDKALKAALDRAAQKMKGLGSAVSGIGTKLAAAGAAIVAPLTAAAVMSAKSGAALYDMSQRTGITASNLSSLGFAAELAGTDLETLEGSIRKMQKAIVAAAGGSKQSAEALAAIGVSVEALSGLSPDEQFRKIAAGLASIQDPTVRAAEAMKIFGKSGTSVLPMVGQLAEMEDYAKKLGLVRTDESARSAKELSVALFVAERAAKSVWGALASAVTPAIKESTAIMLRAAITVRDWVKEHKELVATAFKIGAALVVAGTATAILGRGISLVGSVLGGFGSVIGVARSLIMGTISVVASLVTALGALPIILTAVGAYLLYTTGVGQTMLSALGGYFGDLKDTALEAFGGIKNALSAGDWMLAAQIAWAGLKLAWAQGIQPLETMWVGIKTFALQTWATIGDKIVEYAIRAISGLKDLWSKFKAWFSNLTTDLGDGMVKLLIKFKAFRGDISAGEAENQLAAVDQLNQQAHANNNAERDASLAENDKETQKRLDAIKQIQDAEMARIQARSQEEITATQADLDAKKAALKELDKKAAGEAAKAKTDRFGKGPPIPSIGRLPNQADLEKTTSNIQARGTFSAAGASGLAGSDKLGKQLAVLEQANKLLQTIAKAALDLVRKSPLSFS